MRPCIPNIRISDLDNAVRSCKRAMRHGWSLCRPTWLGMYFGLRSRYIIIYWDGTVEAVK
jgi:hypothetical protein